MNSQAWGGACPTALALRNDNGREYVVETSGFLITRKPKRREKKPGTLSLPVLPIGIL